MSADDATPPTALTPTSTSLSADELREIAAEAREWWMSATEDSFTKIDARSIGLGDRAYAEGVIAERLRGREQMRRWALALVRGSEYARAYYETPGNCSTLAAVEKVERDIGALVDAIDEARNMGLLDGGEK